jgi:copper chaperone
MCSCHQHSTSTAETAVANSDALTFQVEDMTCGHCAGTIKGAIEAKLPGTSVTADPGSKQVSVRGSSDFAAIQSAVIAAGYTPGPKPIG